VLGAGGAGAGGGAPPPPGTKRGQQPFKNYSTTNPPNASPFRTKLSLR
jgi:hypothetical protein